MRPAMETLVRSASSCSAVEPSKRGAQRGDVVGGAVVIGIGGVAQRSNLLQLLLPQRKQAALEF